MHDAYNDWNWSDFSLAFFISAIITVIIAVIIFGIFKYPMLVLIVSGIVSCIICLAFVIYYIGRRH